MGNGRIRGRRFRRRHRLLGIAAAQELGAADAHYLPGGYYRADRTLAVRVQRYRGLRPAGHRTANSDFRHCVPFDLVRSLLEEAGLARMTDIVLVDAFTSKPFSGNPAGVCLLSEPALPDWMQSVAMEMNVSETAFLVPAQGGFDLRWFTPLKEVDLCGHATLASAHVLWQDGHVAENEAAIFFTRSGELTARRLETGWIELDFPARVAEPVASPVGLIEALGIEPKFVGRDVDDFLIEVATAREVRELSPDFAALRAIDARGIIVTSADPVGPYDFLSRFFAPAVGIDEDPVTGSAHCSLAVYWSERLGKKDLAAYQASQRGGEVRMVHHGSRVSLMGQAVTVMRSTLVNIA